MVVIGVSSFSYLSCLEVTHAAAPALRHQPGVAASGPGHLAIESEERQPLLELSPRKRDWMLARVRDTHGAQLRHRRSWVLTGVRKHTVVASCSV